MTAEGDRAGHHNSPSRRLGVIAAVLLATPIGLIAFPLVALLGLLVAAGVLWVVLEPLCSKFPRAALAVLGVLLVVSSPVVVFPLVLHQPPALWHGLLTYLVVVVFFVWPLLQRSVNLLRASAGDPPGQGHPERPIHNLTR
jgi:hypothetical protein